jgi:hypothetical protein
LGRLTVERLTLFLRLSNVKPVPAQWIWTFVKLSNVERPGLGVSKEGKGVFCIAMNIKAI